MNNIIKKQQVERIILFLASQVEYLLHLNDPFLDKLIHTSTLLMTCKKMILIDEFKRRKSDNLKEAY